MVLQRCWVKPGLEIYSGHNAEPDENGWTCMILPLFLIETVWPVWVNDLSEPLGAYRVTVVPTGPDDGLIELIDGGNGKATGLLLTLFRVIFGHCAVTFLSPEETVTLAFL